jgi:hypothetical protein
VFRWQPWRAVWLAAPRSGPALALRLQRVRAPVTPVAAVIVRTINSSDDRGKAVGAMLWERCVLEKLPPGAADKRRELLRASRFDPDLLAMIHKAIAPDPEHRHLDAGALAEDLEACKAGGVSFSRAGVLV